MEEFIILFSALPEELQLKVLLSETYHPEELLYLYRQFPQCRYILDGIKFWEEIFRRNDLPTIIQPQRKCINWLIEYTNSKKVWAKVEYLVSNSISKGGSICIQLDNVVNHPFLQNFGHPLYKIVEDMIIQ